MSQDDWLAHCSELLSGQSQRNQFRKRTIVRAIDSTHVEIDNRRFVNFSANNYLGLSHHPRMLKAMRQSDAAGTGAAGLISGYTQLHAQAESTLAQWKRTESAVLFPSGYQANLGAVQALAAIGETYRNGARFLVDKLSHASLIDAVRATESPMRVFPHNGIAKLRRLLEDADNDQLQVVLTESIFSMDGDAAELKQIANLKQEFPFVLLLDEAHGSGVYGENGAGLASELGLQNAVDISVVTLSKALGIAGGAVCCNTVFRDAILNFGRAYIFSTNVMPAVAACAFEAVSILRDEPQRQNRVRELSRHVRAELARAKLNIPAGDSPIVPVILGSEEFAINAAEDLRQGGLLIFALRPPTVPKGASRLRVTLSCDHTDAEVEQLIQLLKRISS